MICECPNCQPKKEFHYHCAIRVSSGEHVPGFGCSSAPPTKDVWATGDPVNERKECKCDLTIKPGRAKMFCPRHDLSWIDVYSKPSTVNEAKDYSMIPNPWRAFIESKDERIVKLEGQLRWCNQENHNVHAENLRTEKLLEWQRVRPK